MLLLLALRSNVPANPVKLRAKALIPSPGEDHKVAEEKFRKLERLLGGGHFAQEHGIDVKNMSSAEIKAKIKENLKPGQQVVVNGYEYMLNKSGQLISRIDK
jgi:uncharacterized SAM-binding protein YcdF (DUF218 family)